MIIINSQIAIKESEIQFAFTTSQGPGGQNVNKVATAVLLRFNVLNSPSLPEDVKVRLSKKLTKQGDLIIRASQHRTQERNKKDAMHRLTALLQHAAFKPKKRKKTKPTAASVQRRLQQKKLRSTTKILRKSKFNSS